MRVRKMMVGKEWKVGRDEARKRRIAEEKGRNGLGKRGMRKKGGVIKRWRGVDYKSLEDYRRERRTFRP